MNASRRSTSIVRLLAAAVAAMASACSPPPVPDCFVNEDCMAGALCVGHKCVAAPADAGGSRDAGVPAASDSGAVADVGSPSSDVGSPAPDVGSPAPDSGMPAPDGGMPPPDSGSIDAAPDAAPDAARDAAPDAAPDAAAPDAAAPDAAAPDAAAPDAAAPDAAAPDATADSGVGSWITSTPMMNARVPTLAGFNGSVYAISGLDGAAGAVTPVVERFDPGTGMWNTVSPILRPRYGGVSAVVNGRIYVIGGADATHGQVDWVDSFDGTSWRTTDQSMNQARNWPAVAVINNLIYVAGGSAGSPLSSAEVFDPTANGGRGSWAMLPSMPNAHGAGTSGGGGVQAVGGLYFYVAGGPDNTGVSARVDRFDPSSMTWAPSQTVQDLPAARENAAGVVDSNGSFYLAGGDDGTTTQKTMYRFDPILNRWFTQTDMPQPRNGVQLAEMNGKLYFAGGSLAHTTTFFMDLFVFTP